MRLLLLVLRDGCGAGECVFLDYPLSQRLRSSRSVSLSRGVSPRRPLEEFPVLGVHALFAVEIWCIIPLRPCIWQSIPRYLGVALQCLVPQWIRGLCQYLAFGRISHNFWVYVDSDPEAFSLRCHAEWEKCAQQTLQFFGPRRDARTWETGNSFHGILVADMCGGRGQCTGTGP